MSASIRVHHALRHPLALAGRYECVAVPMHQTGDVYPFSADLAATVLPEGWRPIGAVTIANVMLGGTTPAVVACHVVGGVDPADAADAADAKAPAERAALGSAAMTADGPPASAFLLAKQLYGSAGRAPPVPCGT